MYNLGLLLANQWDHPPELDRARTWWERAADAGTTNAMHNLGLLLANQWDPPQLDQARTWYQRPQRRATARHFSSWRQRVYCCDATH